MNAALIAACATNGIHKRSTDYYLGAYRPPAKPEYTIALSIEENKNIRVVRSTPETVDIRFTGEMGLVEIDRLIVKLHRAKDKLEDAIKGEKK